MADIKELDESNIKEFVDSHSLALIDFWGPKCSGCIAIAPYIDELAEEFDGRCAFGKYKVDSVRVWAIVEEKYNVEFVPDIVVYKEGEVVYRGDDKDARLSLKEAIINHL